MNQAAFSIDEMSSTFREFGNWLLREVGPHKAAQVINRYCSFFMEMEKNWKRVPSYGELLKCFGAEGLRRVRLSMRWLFWARNVELDSEAREADSEQRQIKLLLDTIEQDGPAKRVLIAYNESLVARMNEGKTSLRSVRLALRPAVSLLSISSSFGAGLPDQNILDRYLLQAPGQKASVTGFVNFLNKMCGLNLEPRVDRRKTLSARRRVLEKKIMKMAKPSEAGDEFLRKWIAVCLEYFHGVKIRKAVLAQALVEEPDDGGFYVTLGSAIYWLPKWL